MDVPSPGFETISTTEYAPFVCAAGTRIKQRSPGLVCSHSLSFSWLVD
jgi:hypothetical protein